MIELSNQNMLFSIDSLENIRKKEMPAKVAYQFAQIIKTVAQAKILYDRQVDDLAIKYAQLNSNKQIMRDQKNHIIINPENQDKYKEALNQLLQMTKIYNNIQPINLTDIENLTFSPTEMLALLPFLKETKKVGTD